MWCEFFDISRHDLPHHYICHMKFVTWLLIGWMKSLLRRKKNRNFNLYLVRISFLERKTSKKKRGWISRQKAFGVDSKAHFLMWGYFIRTRQAIVTQALLLYIEDKNKQRRENTGIGLEKSSIPHLHLWFLQQQEGKAMKPQWHTEDWRNC